MELTILLSKVFGIYLIIGGVAYLFRQKYFMAAVREFVNDRALRMIVSAVELAAALFLVVNHNIWDTWPERIISLVGWLMILEGASYLLIPDSIVNKVIKVFNTRAWYIVGGIVSILLGIYLVNFGFGLGLF